MPAQLHILAAGISPKATSSIIGGTFSDGGLTAAGTTKATALVLPGASNYISLCSATRGVALPGNFLQGDSVEVYNGGLNACLVYTPQSTTQTITTLSANGGFTVSAAKAATFRNVTGSLWMVNYSK